MQSVYIIVNSKFTKAILDEYIAFVASTKKIIDGRIKTKTFRRIALAFFSKSVS